MQDDQSVAVTLLPRDTETWSNFYTPIVVLTHDPSDCAVYDLERILETLMKPQCHYDSVTVLA